jgi:hypothetical protein
MEEANGQKRLTEFQSVFTCWIFLLRSMAWKPAPVPGFLNACECGGEDVERNSDGLVKEFRCADCGEYLGDTTMGSEP